MVNDFIINLNGKVAYTDGSVRTFSKTFQSDQLINIQDSNALQSLYNRGQTEIIDVEDLFKALPMLIFPNIDYDITLPEVFDFNLHFWGRVTEDNNQITDFEYELTPGNLREFIPDVVGDIAGDELSDVWEASSSCGSPSISFTSSNNLIPDFTTGGLYGFNGSIHGDIALVSDIFADSNIGKVAIFKKIGNAWESQGTIDPPSDLIATAKFFGIGLFVTNKFYIIGDRKTDDTGRVLIFSYDSNNPDNFEFVQELPSTDLVDPDQSDSGIYDFQNNVFFRRNGQQGINESGALYLYRLNPSTNLYELFGDIQHPNPAADADLAQRTLFSNNVIAMSGNFNIDTNSYIFNRNILELFQTIPLLGSGGSPGIRFMVSDFELVKDDGLPPNKSNVYTRSSLDEPFEFSYRISETEEIRPQTLYSNTLLTAWNQTTSQFQVYTRNADDRWELLDSATDAFTFITKSFPSWRNRWLNFNQFNERAKIIEFNCE